MGNYCKLAGLKDRQVLLILTDFQITDDRFLVSLHHLIALGSLRDLYQQEDYDTICKSFVRAAREAGTLGEPRDCWHEYEKKVRDNFRVVLCMSPVDETFRVRARQFPFITANTQIDWFHDWPDEALLSVAESRLEDFELLPDSQRDDTVKALAGIHRSVDSVSAEFKRLTRRENFTTPKSYISFIELYRSLMESKTSQLSGSIERLENGLAKLSMAAEQVDGLQEKLNVQEGELAEAGRRVTEMLNRVFADSQQMEKEREFADIEEQRVNAIAEEVALHRTACQKYEYVNAGISNKF